MEKKLTMKEDSTLNENQLFKENLTSKRKTLFVKKNLRKEESAT